MLYRPHTEEATATQVTGRYLAHNKRPAVKRALLAADLLMKRAVITAPTIEQAACICRVSKTYVRAAFDVAHSQPHLRGSVEHGVLPLIEAARGKPKPAEKLLKAWHAARPDERLAFVRRAGADQVWNVISEVID